jgi:LuxR family maltose regulon positive regulatory protein
VTRKPRPPLLESKLSVPVPQTEQLERPALRALLDELATRRLTVVVAPTGYGKTTTLAAWARAADVRVAWVSIDADDDDLVRHLSYVVTALGRASGGRDTEPAMRALRRATEDPLEAVLPYVLNALAALEQPIVLVLDDYQWIENRACHAATRELVLHAPEQLRVVLSTRLDPVLPLGLLRARGELGEVRASELSFSDEEAGLLLNGLLALDLDSDLVEQLNRRAEGWPAGLYLAALSVAAAPDRRAFVESFAGSNRHVVEYLGTEVLAATPDEVQQFLLRTSILDRLCAPLCDVVAGLDESSHRLAELVRTNLFLTPLDSEGQWYRFHRLFAELLRSELRRRSPELEPELHRRAAVWYEAEGQLEETVHHALAAGDEDRAVDAIAALWRPLFQFGQHASLRRLLRQLRPETVDRSAPLSFLAAIVAGSLGDPRETFEHHLAMVERSGWQGPFPDGLASSEAATAFARMMFPYDDLGAALAAARLLSELAPDDVVLYSGAQAAQARVLYLLGELDAARDVLPDYGRDTAAERPIISAASPAIRSLLELRSGNVDRAVDLAGEAAEVAEQVGIADFGVTAIAWVALGSALAAGGDVAAAEAALERAIATMERPADALYRAYALLCLARVRAARGDATGARKLLVNAREIVDRASDPGALREQLAELERRLSTRSRRDVSYDALPTESELRVLRLLASGVTRSEIAKQLFLSQNTVKSHQRALYRKLGASTRETAVKRARELGLV